MSTKIEQLPEECLVNILLLTSPEDIIRSSAVSKHFFSVAISDHIWKKFLPSDYTLIIRHCPFRFNSLMDLFPILCRSHILIDHKTKSLSLDKKSWKKSYMLGSRSLSIVRIDFPGYWSWKSVPESRFPENAKMDCVYWLDIKGLFPTNLLSLNTTYGAYFVFKQIHDQDCFVEGPVKVSLSVVDKHMTRRQTMSKNSVYLTPPEPPEEFYSDEEEEDEQDEEELDELVTIQREDGWLEVELGTYQVGSTTSENVFLEMSLTETEMVFEKTGLVIQGIELRPLIGKCKQYYTNYY